MTRRAAMGLGVSLALFSACAVNPATGRLQLSLVSKGEEAALGASVDEEVVAAMGVYDDEALGAYISGVGAHVAKQAARPDLEWTFRLLDDHTVNAFALPGGYVYVARGLLAHMNSEAELAAALGHEIAHVAARHGANQVSRARIASRGVGLFRVIDPGLRHVGGVAAGGAVMNLLRHSREHELQADSLGLRYLGASGYDRDAMASLLQLLASLQEDDRPPAWASTHPDPKDRVRRMASRGLSVDAPEPDLDFLKRLDGLPVGPDPRDGLLTGDTWTHVRAGYAIRLPAGWEHEPSGSMAFSSSVDDKAMLATGASGHEKIGDAYAAFFSGDVLQATGEPEEVVLKSGFSAIVTAFQIQGEDKPFYGMAAFAEVDAKVVLFLALGDAEHWSWGGDLAAQAFASLRRPTAAERNVAPRRIRLVRTSKATTLRDLASASDEVLVALTWLNRLEPDEALPAGRTVKLLR